MSIFYLLLRDSLEYVVVIDQLQRDGDGNKYGRTIKNI